MKNRVQFFPELAGVRALAALLVCFYHIVQVVPPLPETVNPVVRSIVNAFVHDYVTVDIFFVLSGFLITALLLRDQGKPDFFRNFYWRRALRILPVFVIGLLLFWHLVPGSGTYVLICLLLVANFNSRFGIPVTSPIWTLCIEEQFYLIWPQALRRCKPRAIAWLAISLAAFSFVLRPTVDAIRGSMNIQYTFYRLDGLGLGALAGCVYMARDELGSTLTRILQILSSWTLAAIATATLLISPLFPNFHYQSPLSIALTSFLTFRFILAVMNGWTSSFISSKTLAFIASISYGMYMYHGFVIIYVFRYLGQPGMLHPWALMWRILVIFSLTILLSTISLYVLEKPVQRLRPYLLKRDANAHEAHATQTQPAKCKVDEFRSAQAPADSL